MNEAVSILAVDLGVDDAQAERMRRRDDLLAKLEIARSRRRRPRSGLGQIVTRRSVPVPELPSARTA